MQASSKYTKAIHICIYLSMHSNEIVSSSILAESLSTNPVVIRKLLKILREGQIVNSVAGSKGGFELGKSPKEIDLWQLYLLMRDEDFFQRPKVNPDCVVSSNLKVLVHDTFTSAEISMRESLQQKNIAHLTADLKSILLKSPSEDK